MRDAGTHMSVWHARLRGRSGDAFDRGHAKKVLDIHFHSLYIFSDFFPTLTGVQPIDFVR